MNRAVKGKIGSTEEGRRLVRLAQRLLSAIAPVTAEAIGLEMMVDVNPPPERQLGHVLYAQYREAYRKGEVGGEPITREELHQARQEARVLLEEIGRRPKRKIYSLGPPRPGYVKEIDVKYKFRRVCKTEWLLGRDVYSAYDVFRLFKDLRYETREHLMAIHTDLHRRIIATDRLAVGTERECPVSHSGVFRNAMFTGAAFIIIVHNHPSGRPEPSAGDHAIMEDLTRVGQLTRIPVIDFVIIGDRKYWSASDCGLIRDGRYLRPGEFPVKVGNSRTSPTPPGRKAGPSGGRNRGEVPCAA